MPLFAALASVAGAETLFGVTTATPAGSVDLVEIDTSTGQATLHATLAIGAGNAIQQLAWVPSAARLVAAGTVSGGNALIRIDPTNGQVTTAPLVGLPGSNPIVAGIEFDAAGNRLLVSFADDGSAFEDRVAEVALDGTVGSVTSAFTSDMDALGYRAPTATLLGFDLNAVTSQKVFAITGLFASPGVATIGSPSARSDVGDVALDAAGVVYVNGWGAGGGFLLRLDSDTSWVTLGTYGASSQVRGIAFRPTVVEVPALSASLRLLLFAAIALSAGAFSSRLRSGRSATR